MKPENKISRYNINISDKIDRTKIAKVMDSSYFSRISAYNFYKMKYRQNKRIRSSPISLLIKNVKGNHNSKFLRSTDLDLHLKENCDAEFNKCNGNSSIIRKNQLSLESTILDKLECKKKPELAILNSLDNLIVNNNKIMEHTNIRFNKRNAVYLKPNLLCRPKPSSLVSNYSKLMSPVSKYFPAKHQIKKWPITYTNEKLLELTKMNMINYVGNINLFWRNRAMDRIKGLLIQQDKSIKYRNPPNM